MSRPIEEVEAENQELKINLAESKAEKQNLIHSLQMYQNFDKKLGVLTDILRDYMSEKQQLIQMNQEKAQQNQQLHNKLNERRQ